MSDAFHRLLDEAGDDGLPADDLLHVALPLLRQVAAWHEQSLVAPLDGLEALGVTEDGALACVAPPRAPLDARERIAALQRPVTSALHVIGRRRLETDDDQALTATDLDVVDDAAEPERPAFVTRYRTWESLCGHHDALTDVLALGQLLASLALGLDFMERDELALFAAHRESLFALRPRVHPVIAAVIVEMTELDRARRAADLPSVIERLRTYRDQPAPAAWDRGALGAQPLQGRRRLVLERLRNRLFDVSRRNRLVYFQPSQSSVNLTVASVPLVVNLASIRLEDLFVWQPALADALLSGQPFNLGARLRFEDQPYLPAALDKLMADARRDRAEYGFAQLRLVIAFLQWHDLKETPQERIVSPLLLLPVELTRRKGVRDQYVLEAVSQVAEVNPALRHHLAETYGLELPEDVDLRATTIEQVHGALQEQIRATEPGVTLRLVDKPEIRLVHERAAARTAQWKRRAALRLAREAQRTPSYSYDRDTFRPLGLQLFLQRVLPATLPQRIAAGGAPDARMPHAGPPRETLSYALRDERPGNPYAWDLDLCSVTLGNFNYRKMTLVRDYGALIAGDHASESFDRVFSLEPKPVDDQPPAPLPRAEAWPVVAGDATQSAAVALARGGRSFIIQGPPGTGKSQTITNLIADQLARGRRVLFACAKRAAIDVVFHRLRTQGLDDLCCLIHDSQADKKGFVMDLKRTYEAWLESTPSDALAERDALVRAMEQDLDALRRFDDAMRSVPPRVAKPVRELLHRLVALREREPALTPEDAERLPDFATWRAHADLARRIAATLAETTSSRTLAAHPFRRLAPGVLASDRPLETLSSLASRADALLDAVDAALARSGVEAAACGTMAQAEELARFAATAAPAVTRGLASLLDPRSPESEELRAATADLARLDDALRRAETRTTAWRDKLAPADTEAALAQARAQESSVLRWLQPSWYRLRGVVRARHDMTRHAVAPTLTRVLEDLVAEHARRSERDAALAAATARYGASPSAMLATCAGLQDPSRWGPGARALRDSLLRAGDFGAMTAALALEPALREMSGVLDALVIGWRGEPLAALAELVRDLHEESHALPDLLPLLTELAEAPARLAEALRTYDFEPDVMEAAIARASLEAIYRSERWLPRVDGRLLAARSGRVADNERRWFAANAGGIREHARRRFREHVRLSGAPAAQLDADGKAFKKAYAAGRRELEHEFGKTMRYKSIRELAAGDSGLVVRDLKPVWLMSPLSVSDTLPLEAGSFDVVIFDEASQIPVEESVPTLHRAPQVIVVGDEMQLPPTTFFAASRDASDDVVEADEGGERVAVMLDSDSLLTQAAKNLPATLLAWHYRSRSESLIGFSNAAFYSGELYTIPDRTLPPAEHADLVVRDGFDVAQQVDALLARPLSFHVLERSPYVARRNPGEAACIAELVREMLRRETGSSIGIVAFSEAQQSEIESALAALAESDREFGARLEAEVEREEDDQFCGLFVKNLENVQGDERDVILLSVCYGPDASGRMLMNFGPINQRGGEKRLNVIFSRARKHMAVVTSIRHGAITNDTNDGAAALKGFLRYAEACSRGEAALAKTLLEGMHAKDRRATRETAGADAVVTQLAQALRARGLVVAEDVGQSRFSCPLAVRRAGDPAHVVGILVDTADAYETPAPERFVARPAILRAFGWHVVAVLTKDWYHEPDAVIDRIERALRGEADDAELEPVAPPEPVPLTALEPGPVTSAPPRVTESGAGARRFELVEGRSSKFWEIAQDGCTVTVRFGRIGTHGQSLPKTFETPARAAAEVAKLTAEKLRKGYRELR